MHMHTLALVQNVLVDVYILRLEQFKKLRLAEHLTQLRKTVYAHTILFHICRNLTLGKLRLERVHIFWVVPVAG